MFDELLANFAERLALFETQTFSEFSQTHEEEFVTLSELDSGAESTGGDENSAVPALQLEDSRFVSLNQSMFVELDRQ